MTPGPVPTADCSPFQVLHSFELDWSVFTSIMRNHPRTGRNPGRRDGFLWNGNTFLCPSNVDGFRCDLRNTVAAATYEEADRTDSEEIVGPDPRVRERHEIALSDIARLVKSKGPAKSFGFEMLDAPRRVIALDEDIFSDGPQLQFWTTEDDDWEDINAFDCDGESSGREAGDYLLARRLQDEEDALYAHQRGDSGVQRRAYSDVLAAGNGESFLFELFL
ncbi:hypothetical protein B0H16DRAFT_1030988 [Mycena metata]|uniref:Uncharacterized protein n=1 Tax=Mycena metata TaxID=1033252 RepID=A0AAD7IFN5_9AGAR|nr:hypothetical protein B0H16DRAFT_1030988 [Mycena metata]